MERQRNELYPYPEVLSQGKICRLIIEAGAVEIRDVDAGEEPFLYSSGNYGPGYVMIKGLVGQERVFKTLTEQLALRIVDKNVNFDFIAANATGGMVPGYQLREDLQRLTGRKIPYVYVRNTRKLGGHNDIVTGAANNPEISKGDTALVVEELVNFSQTTANSAIALREEGYPVHSAATILYYANPQALERLAENDINLYSLTTLPILLEVGLQEGFFSPGAIASYRDFLKDPKGWQAVRGIQPVTV